MGFGYNDFETPVSPLTYSSDELRELNTAFSRGVPTTTTINIPKEPNRRKRGKAGGLRRRIRACKQKPYLPSVIMGNVQSQINKIDEISANVQYFHDFRTGSVMSFTETWLRNSHNDALVEVDGFKLLRGDRTEESGESRRGWSMCLRQREMVPRQ